MNQSPPLQLTEEQMRTLGYGVVDLLVEHVLALRDRSPVHRATRPEMEMLFREDMPSGSQDPQAVLARLERDVFSHIIHPDHPRFFAFVPGPGNFVGALADALASGFNVFSGTWLESAAPTEIELVTVDWLRAACGLPDTAGGLFTSGGSAANLAALATARHVKLGEDMAGAVIYCSDQTHSSVLRALRILGFPPAQLRSLPADEAFRLDPRLLAQTVAEDRAAGLRPFCVVASAGTTNTGAIDPLPELADFCRAEKMWLHADGAFGASAVFCERGQALLKGLGQVDSLSIDPHKWLFQPFECGCLLVRDRHQLRDTFHILPEYLVDTAGAAEEVNFCDYGPQLTRRFRALKLWMSLQVFGKTAFSEAVERGFYLAELAGHILATLPGWRVVTPAQMGIITFRAEPKGYTAAQLNDHNQRLVDAILDDGYAVVVSTRLRGQTVLRMCTINPRTTEVDISQTLDRLNMLSNSLL